MAKKNPTLGNGNYTLMIIEDSIIKSKGLAIVDVRRFNTSDTIDGRVDLTHIKKLDEDKDVIIHFANIKGVEALISELELIKLDMQLNILAAEKR